MATELNSDENFNELIFEDRNKKYGAYVIRRSYNETVTKSLLITLGSVFLLLSAALFFAQREDKLPDLGPNDAGLLGGIIIDIPIPVEKLKPEIKPEILQKDPEPIKSQTGALEASDDKKDVLEKTNDDFHIAKVNVEKGADSAAGPVIKDPVGPAVVPENNDLVMWAPEMPEFNGNMYKFIKDHMNYPRIAVENGTQGTVMLSFVVEKDGSIGDIKILNPVDDGCTQEAIRVVRMMPTWKPGKSNGQLVRVQYNLPVKFKLKS